MTEPRRRRALGAAVLGSALLLAGCAVPGQEGSPGVAAASEQTTLTSARVTELYDAWAEEAHKPIPRDQVVTLELLREPMLEHIDELQLQYSRYSMEQEAISVKEYESIAGEPSEAMIDGLEATYLLAAYTMIPEDDSLLRSIAEEVAETTTVSPREGEFNVDQLLSSISEASETAVSLANAGQPGWFMEFNVADFFTASDSEWLASE
ncbi:hypothetical protein [Demequina sp. NBRC 110057]|uniref:hypothetical protein n=1 Tax=Demequina sp. NBRC 110057 TaxID=1570346 RepID=UPI000A001628|nr:hypothetical protein [Demequina sp. NBRC 110057]